MGDFMAAREKLKKSTQKVHAWKQNRKLWNMFNEWGHGALGLDVLLFEFFELSIIIKVHIQNLMRIEPSHCSTATWLQIKINNNKNYTQNIHEHEN